MDCKTARAVWNHPEGFIAGVHQHLPGALERIESHVKDYVNGETNPFHQTVRQLVKLPNDAPVFTAHAEDDDLVAERVHDVVGDLVGKLKLEEYFSQWFGRPVTLGNICCSGCIVYDDGLTTPETLEAIQRAAIQIEPDGSLVA